MKHDLRKLLSEIRSDKALLLSEEEKASMESRLREYMAFKPLPTRSLHTYASTYVYYVRYVALALIVALLSSSTASYAAEGALPGDTLYVVKIHINENVRRALAHTPEARAEVESELAARRLDEAHELAKQKRLTPALRAALEDDFDEHADRVEVETEALEDEDKDAARMATTRFESKLKERKAKFEELEDDDSDEFKKRIDRRTKNISEHRERVERPDRESNDSDDEEVENDREDKKGRGGEEGEDDESVRNR